MVVVLRSVPPWCEMIGNGTQGFGKDARIGVVRPWGRKVVVHRSQRSDVCVAHARISHDPPRCYGNGYRDDIRPG